MQAGATDGLDVWDLDCSPTPPAGFAGIYFLQNALEYQKEVRGIGPEADWLLVVIPDAVDVPLSWGVARDLPADKYLSLWELTAADKTAPPVGGTAIDMAETSALTVPAGGPRFYVIRYATDRTVDLDLLAGWNLISLPIEPHDPAVAHVLDDGLGGSRSGPALRDGLRGVVNVGSVWGWWNGRYIEALELHALRGYWVFVAAPMSLLVRGLPPAELSFVLGQGWTAVGPPFRMAVPRDARLQGHCWQWHPALMRYLSVDEMAPCRGFWINATAAFDLELPQ
jgi:hypothetical protein